MMAKAQYNPFTIGVQWVFALICHHLATLVLEKTQVQCFTTEHGSKQDLTWYVGVLFIKL